MRLAVGVTDNLVLRVTASRLILLASLSAEPPPRLVLLALILPWGLVAGLSARLARRLRGHLLPALALLLSRLGWRLASWMGLRLSRLGWRLASWLGLRLSRLGWRGRGFLLPALALLLRGLLRRLVPLLFFVVLGFLRGQGHKAAKHQHEDCCT
jgi:hypothetical protein